MMSQDAQEIWLFTLLSSIPGEQQEAFLSLLVRKCGHRQLPQDKARPELIFNLLRELVKQKQLALAQPGQRNVTLISQWLQNAGIPHREPYLAF